MNYFFRHGEDDECYVGGWGRTSLTSNGINQVKSVRNLLLNYDIKRIVSSDLVRARETAILINELLDVDVIYSSLLREINKGILNGIELTLAMEKYREYLNMIDIRKKYPLGESLLDFYERVKSLEEEDNTLYITHRGFINMMYMIKNGDDISYLSKYDIPHASLHKSEYKKMVIVKK